MVAVLIEPTRRYLAMKNVLSFLTILTLSTLFTVSVWAEGNIALTTEADKANYSVGYQMGTDFKKQDWKLSPEAMLQSIRYALNAKQPQLSEATMTDTLARMKRKLILAQEQASINYRQASLKFLEENAKKDGVVVLPSRVQYKVLKDGTGRTPTIDDTIRVHFKLSRVDGTELGSTYSNSDPRVVPLATARPGLQEVLLQMKEGAIYEIVIPSGIKGDRDNDDTGAVIYEMSLISIKPKV